MIITIREFRIQPRQQVAVQTLTAFGASAPMGDLTGAVRIETDTAVLVDGTPYAASSVSGRWVSPGQVLTFTAP